MNKPTPEELVMINQFSKKELTADEVCTFKVALCNNDIDRDCEKFSVAALQKLAELFVGKTGIFDHSWASDNQKMRVFNTYIQTVEGKLTKDGEPFTELMAQVYLLNTEDNRALIDEIDAGIKKEVSVGCSLSTSTCSICGKNVRKERCKHIPGKEYSGKMCHRVLENPTDAYEFSFVAVPAQPEAGVRKSLKQKLDEGREFRQLDIALGAVDLPDKRILYKNKDGSVFVTEDYLPNAFEQCNMKDFVFRNEKGDVIERVKDGLEYLYGSAKFSIKTKNFAILYAHDAEISFKVAADEWETIKHDDGVTEYRRIIKAVEKIYDVSAISADGEGAASASARKVCDGVITAWEAERLRATEDEKRSHKIRLKLKLMEV